MLTETPFLIFARRLLIFCSTGRQLLRVCARPGDCRQVAQTLEALLPFLPLSLTAASDPQEHQQQQRSSQTLLPSSDSDPHSPSPSSISLVLSSRSAENHHSHQHTATTARKHRDSSTQITSNRISPDSSIPAATCIKISLQPTPTFKLVQPRCPHLQQKNRNRRHHHQQQHHQQQQQQQHPSNPHSHPSHSSHSCHTSSHTHSRAQHRHTHNDTMTSLDHSSSTLPGSKTIPVKFSFPASFTATTPEKVQVTGTFNAWQRTEPLVRNQDSTRFEGEFSVDLEKVQDQDKGQDKDKSRTKILFKFVLDDNQWVTDPDQAIERDYAGNLNNVLFLETPPATANTPSNDTRSSEDPRVSTPATAVAAASSAAEHEESDEERIARLKQEEEDDATIRQLGGGMWGTPFFAVNDPADLPEHFTDNPESCVATMEDVAVADIAHEVIADDHHQESETVVPPAAVQSTETVPESSQEEKIVPETKQEEEEEDEDDKIIRSLGGGMWGTPFFAVNDPADLPEHFIDNPESSVSTSKEVAAADVPNEVIADKHPQEAETVAPSALAKAIEVVPESPQEKAIAPEKKEEQEEEDEDDKIIRALGGGMWGTPFFQVNDPAVLPEHFVEAVSASHPDAVARVTAIKEEDEDEDEVCAVPASIVTARDVSSFKDVHKGEVLRDQIFDTVDGTLTETVVETTEDTVIEAADGTVLEETITTNVEDTISGQLHESVTEVVETVDEIEPAIEQKSLSSAPIITMSETETIKVTHGEDGIDTTVLEETITFTDGPEVDSDSLHSLTTGIKPVQSGETIIVEQSPEVVVLPVQSDSGTTGAGDATPAIDPSVDIVPFLTHSQTTSTASSSSVSSQSATVNTTGKVSVHGDEHDGDGDYGEVVLQSKPIHMATDSAVAMDGDAKPTADLSTATLATLPTTPAAVVGNAASKPSTKTATATTGISATDMKTEKFEKRKSIWKKIKKVLA
ncbi:hypothetical protein BGZ68_006155 [Mortierella alpina]|nr:hypothetical protein BGZ68_006155 [Mortierella alpina]